MEPLTHSSKLTTDIPHNTKILKHLDVGATPDLYVILYLIKVIYMLLELCVDRSSCLPHVLLVAVFITYFAYSYRNKLENLFRQS